MYLHLNCVTSILEQTSTFCDVLKKEKIDGVCVSDDLFQSSRPGDFDVTPTTVGGCSTYSVPWGTKATKLYLFLDDIFQPSHAIWCLCC